jgi:hypothetical protein
MPSRINTPITSLSPTLCKKIHSPGHQGIYIRLHSVPHKWRRLNLPSVEGPTTFDNAAAPINIVTIYEQFFKDSSKTLHSHLFLSCEKYFTIPYTTD